MSIPTLQQAVSDLRQALEETSMASVAPRVRKKLKKQRREYLFSEVHPKREPLVNQKYAQLVAERLEDLGKVDLCCSYVYSDGLPILTADEMRQHLFDWVGYKFNRDLCNEVLKILSERARDP